MKLNVIGYTKAEGNFNGSEDVNIEITFDSFNTRYYLDLYTYDEDDNKSPEGIGEVKTGRITPWKWTDAEKNAFNNHGKTNTLTATKWKSFCSYINGMGNSLKEKGYLDRYDVISRSDIDRITMNGRMEGWMFFEPLWRLNNFCVATETEYDYPRRWWISNRKNYLWALFYGYFSPDNNNLHYN